MISTFCFGMIQELDLDLYLFWNDLQSTCLTIFCVFICRHVSLDGLNERHGRRAYGDFGMWV
jgi:hypothetical protein